MPRQFDGTKSISFTVVAKRIFFVWMILLIPQISEHLLDLTISVQVCLNNYGRSTLPVRPGAFNANFDLNTLDSFRTLCKSHGLQYIKVLEQLAEMYLETNGEVLHSVSVPRPPTVRNTIVLSQFSSALHDLLQRLKQVETSLEMHLSIWRT